MLETVPQSLSPRPLDLGVLYRLFERHYYAPTSPLDIPYSGVKQYHEQH